MAQDTAHKPDQSSVLNPTMEGEHQLLEVASVVHAQSRNMHMCSQLHVCAYVRTHNNKLKQNNLLL